jgi:hypothetical protein
MLQSFDLQLPPEMKLSYAADPLEWARNTAQELAFTDLLCSSSLASGNEKIDEVSSAVKHFSENYLSYLAQRHLIMDAITPTPAAIRRYYETHPQDFGSTSRIMIRLLKMNTKADANRAFEMLSSGTSVAKVEHELSQMTARTRGHLLGPYPCSSPDCDRLPDALLVPGLYLGKGDFTQPLAMADAYYIVYVDRVAPGHRVPLELVQDTIRERLRLEEAAVREAELYHYLLPDDGTTSTQSPPAPAWLDSELHVPNRLDISNTGTRSISEKRVAAFCAVARAANLDKSEEFKEALSWFQMRKLAEDELDRRVEEIAQPVSADDITSYLIKIRAFRSGDDFSEHQITLARNEIARSRSDAAKEQIRTSVLKTAGFQFEDHIPAELFCFTEEEARQAAYLSAGRTHWAIIRVAAIQPCDCNTTVSQSDTGESGLLPKPVINSDDSRRAKQWKVVMLRKFSDFSPSSIIVLDINNTNVTVSRLPSSSPLSDSTSATTSM